MNFQTFKRGSAAYKFAGERPVLRVGNVFLVPDTADSANPDSVRLESIELIAMVQRPGCASRQREIVGQVTFRHLNRLGNANHATAHPRWSTPNAFTTSED